MTERPILFSGQMVRAILEGRKTQTRRLVTCRYPISFIGPAGEEHDPRFWGYFFDGPDHNGYAVLGRGLNDRQDNGMVSIPCPYGVPGDRLWVRETWRTSDAFDAISPSKISAQCLDAGYSKAWGPAKWEADSKDSGGIDDFGGSWGKLRPSIFMPRWASRIVLEVSDVRVQRLQCISEDDAQAEGVSRNDAAVVFQAGTSWFCDSLSFTARDAYAVLWDSINAKRALWSINPWVWAVTFAVVR